MSRCLLAGLMLFAAAASAFAAQRKPLVEVDPDAFTSDTQVTAEGAGDNHVALAWWIPREFWQSILGRDSSMPTADKTALLSAMQDVSLLAIVQGDISPLGAFSFYSKDEIQDQLKLEFSGSGGKSRSIAPLREVSADLEVVLGVFKPILSAAMGKLGQNMHFYVLDDRAGNTARLMDPYLDGQLDIGFARRDKSRLQTRIELPINALFVPRQCPNGKYAHITWQYCPWSGHKLDR